MLRTYLFLSLVNIVLAWTPTQLTKRDNSTNTNGTDQSAIESCLSLQTSCNSTTADFNNFYTHVPCIMLTTCSVLEEKTPQQVLVASGAPVNQPRLTQETFQAMSGGKSSMSQQNYVDAYYNAVFQSPGGIYPSNITQVIEQWQAIAAWTGFCDTMVIPYDNFADWLEFSSAPGVCGAATSCNANATSLTCVPQPATDNGSCAEIVKQCRFWSDGGLFQNEYCVLASMCYAWSDTDVLLAHLYPTDTPPPTTSEQADLSPDVFYNMTSCSDTLSEQDVIDAYYRALTGTWTSSNGTVDTFLNGTTVNMTLTRTNNDGPYPTSPQYIIDFWTVISAWTGFCSTRAIPYSNLADYFLYAAGSNYHPTC